MAKGFKTGGKDFQKGVVTNPHGAPRIPEDLKQARALTKIEFERLANRILYLKDSETRNILKNDHENIEGIVAKIIIMAKEHGDEKRLNFLLDRIIGKVSEKIEGNMTFRNEAEIAKLAAMNDEELVSYVQEHAKGLLSKSKDD